MKPAAVILAGGSGRRLGGVHKGLLTWRGEAFAVHLIRLLGELGPVAVVAQARQYLYREMLQRSGLGAEFVPDPWVDQGPMAGLVAGLAWARERGCDGMVVAPCDSPRLALSWRERVLAAARAAPTHIHVCEVEGRLQPLHGWFPVTVEGRLRDAVLGGERRVGRWVAAQSPEILGCSDLAEQFLNVNTPEDRGQLAP